MFLKKGDYVVTIFVFILSAAIFFLFNRALAGHSSTAQIIVDGKTEHTIQLDQLTKTEIFEINSDYHIVIEAEKGRVRFKESDCPDQVCVQTGWVSSSGKVAACVPAKVLLKISNDQSEVDVILH